MAKVEAQSANKPDEREKAENEDNEDTPAHGPRGSENWYVQQTMGLLGCMGPLVFLGGIAGFFAIMESSCNKLADQPESPNRPKRSVVSAPQPPVPEKSPEDYNNLGISYRQKGQSTEALAAYNKAIDLKPDFGEAYNNRGSAYAWVGAGYLDKKQTELAMKQFDSAIADFSKAIELNGNLSQPYNNRATAHFMKKDYESAWADIRKCKQLGGTVKESFIKALSQASGRKE